MGDAVDTRMNNVSSCETTSRLHPAADVPAQVTLGLVLVVITFVSVLGNVMTCTIVYRTVAMRSAVNLLLTNMALSDLTLSITVMPFVLCRLLKTNIGTYVGVCVCFSMLKEAALCASVYTLLVITMDRYLIIVHRKDRLDSRTSKEAILLIWCWSFLISSPQLLSFQGDAYESYDYLLCGLNLCNPSIFTSVYTVVVSCLVFFLPVAAMFYLCSAILRAVQRSCTRIHHQPHALTITVSVTQYSSKLGLPPVPCRPNGDLTAKRRSFGTILLLFLVLLSCWLPYVINRTVFISAEFRSVDTVATVVLLSVGFLKSSLYPVIYSVRNKRYRKACMQIIPTTFKFPSKFKCVGLHINQTRVNPSAVYECPV